MLLACTVLCLSKDHSLNSRTTSAFQLHPLIHLPPLFFSFLGRIRQGCQLSTYTEIPTLTAAQCNSRRLARRRDRKGRWQRRLCSSLQTTLASSSFLAHRPPAFLCQPNHTQKRRSLTRLPRSAHDEGGQKRGRTQTTITSHYLTTIILFGPCIRMQVAPLDPSGLGLKGKVPLGL